MVGVWLGDAMGKEIRRCDCWRWNGAGPCVWCSIRSRGVLQNLHVCSIMLDVYLLDCYIGCRCVD